MEIILLRARLQKSEKGTAFGGTEKPLKAEISAQQHRKAEIYHEATR